MPHRRRLHIGILLIVCGITCIVLDSTAQNTLTGLLTDKQTREPVPYANIFFAHTTLGTSSLADGSFTLERIPNGKYDLLVEVVGYQRHKQPIEFLNGKYRLELELVQDTIQLSPITVVADQADRKYYPLFVRFFVGDAGHAKQCEILNKEVLHFYFDKPRNRLTVTARNPVEIVNPALGYKVHYTLERFELDFTTGAKLMQGSPRFEELTPRRKKDPKTWEKNRNQAYQGSLYHFMRSLYHDALQREGFTLSVADSSQSTAGREETLRPLPDVAWVRNDHVATLNFQGLLKLEYSEKQDWHYPGRAYSYFKGGNLKGYQQTYLRLNHPSVEIYENGYFSDQLSVFLTGYLVWRETVCNMVPLGHEVKSKKKTKKKKSSAKP